MKRLLVITMTVVCPFMLTACKQDEQGRPITYEKGVYGGAEDQTLTKQQQEKLRARANFQKD